MFWHPVKSSQLELKMLNCSSHFFSSKLGIIRQSLISINQIGLAIWGYVLGAVSVGVCVGSANQNEGKQTLSTKVSRKNIERFDFSNHLAGAGAALGLALAIPIFSAEASWRSATESKNSRCMISKTCTKSEVKSASSSAFLPYAIAACSVR